jgi:hypothetical protein
MEIHMGLLAIPKSSGFPEANKGSNIIAYTTMVFLDIYGYRDYYLNKEVEGILTILPAGIDNMVLIRYHGLSCEIQGRSYSLRNIIRRRRPCSNLVCDKPITKKQVNKDA